MVNLVDAMLSVIFSILIGLHLSWLTILLYPKREDSRKDFPSLSVVIPAYNEEKSIDSTIRSVLEAEYPCSVEVIVVNDGSTDKTGEILKRMAASDSRVKLGTANHAGKANAINIGVEKSVNEIIVVLDADSQLEKKSLMEIVKPFSKDSVGGVSGIVRAAYRNNPLTWFQDFEYIQSSAWRFICNKIGGTYIFPGFAAFRRDAFLSIGGFSKDTLSEDLDIGLRLKKAGYQLRMSTAVMHTQVPETFGGLVKQRTRWGRGTAQVMKKHSDMIFNKEYGSVGLYGIPTQLYWYIHCFVYLPLFVYQLTEGYFRYFINKNVWFSFDVAKYFFGWFSVYGMIDYSYKTFSGMYEITTLFILLLVMFISYLVYNLFLVSKFASLRHPRFLFVIFFFFPYSLFTLLLHALPAIREINNPASGNIWEKSQ